MPPRLLPGGSYAYLGGTSPIIEHTFSVADLSDPTLPEIVGELLLSDPIVAVQVSGSYAYLAAGGLRVVDVSNPTAPTEVGFQASPDCVSGVAVCGNYAFVSS